MQALFWEGQNVSAEGRKELYRTKTGKGQDFCPQITQIENKTALMHSEEVENRLCERSEALLQFVSD